MTTQTANIPAAGGSSHIKSPDGTMVQFLSWRDSAFRYAQAYGYEGPAAEPIGLNVTYLDGLVQAQEFLDAGHVRPL